MGLKPGKEHDMHQTTTVTGGPSLLALGFRPFFLLAGAWALAAMLLWLAMLRGLIPVDGYYGPTTWHAHEMLFGYTGAVIAGFLLTAVRNWTGLPTPTGASLAALAGLWLAHGPPPSCRCRGRWWRCWTSPSCRPWRWP
jgi:uncharacterized protein involved in response to NO